MTVENSFLYFKLVGKLEMIPNLEKMARKIYNQNTVM